MFDWLFVSPPERRLLGAARFGGPTPWVIAIMSFSIMLIAATGLALASTASLMSNAIESRYTLQVPGGGSNLDALVQAVRSTPGVTGVQAVSESDSTQVPEVLRIFQEQYSRQQLLQTKVLDERRDKWSRANGQRYRVRLRRGYAAGAGRAKRRGMP